MIGSFGASTWIFGWQAQTSNATAIPARIGAGGLRRRCHVTRASVSASVPSVHYRAPAALAPAAISLKRASMRAGIR